MDRRRQLFGGGWSVGGAERNNRRQRPTVIGVDCDGVLASDRQLWQQMHARFPQDIPARYEDLTSFEWPRATPETTALCLKLSADPQFAARLAPIPRMAQALRRLHGAGYEIHIITARPACVREATRRWLRAHGVADCVAEIHCVESGLAKVPLARALGCAAFVEDNYLTAEAMGAAGIRSYLLDAPYNQGAMKHCIRIRGWRALLDDLARHISPHSYHAYALATSARSAVSGVLVS